MQTLIVRKSTLIELKLAANQRSHKFNTQSTLDGKRILGIYPVTNSTGSGTKMAVTTSGDSLATADATYINSGYLTIVDRTAKAILDKLPLSAVPNQNILGYLPNFLSLENVDWEKSFFDITSATTPSSAAFVSFLVFYEDINK